MKLKIGIAQIANSTDLAKNFSGIMHLISQLKKQEVDLILFPECSLSGFTANMKKCTDKVLNPYLNQIQSWVNKNNTEIVLPTAIVENEKIYNSGFWFKQEERHQFYKLGLTDSERKFFSTPKQPTPKVFNTKGFNLGLLICYEAEHKPWSYFEEDQIDTILWPGYWGWSTHDEWTEFRDEDQTNPIYTNMNTWKVPLLQSNFAFNDIDNNNSKGPEGLSFIINSNNKIFYKGPHSKVCCFTVQLNKHNGLTEIERCH